MSLDREFEWDELLTLLGQGEVVAILGWELLTVAREDGTRPLQSVLASGLAESLGMDAESQEYERLDQVAMAYERSGGDARRLYSRLKAVYDQACFEPPEALKCLARIPELRLFISLTFDGLLTRALDQERFQRQDRTRSLSFSTRRPVDDISPHWSGSPDPVVYQLFGQLSSKADYAITEADHLEYMQALQSERRPENLFGELRERHLLFLGCGYENWLERFLIRTLAGKELRRDRMTFEFVADQPSNSDSRLTLFLTHHGTQVYQEGDAGDFLDELCRRWAARHSDKDAVQGRGSPTRSNPPMEPGSVFLSYASGDREAVQQLFQALDENHVDTWYDVERLEAGDDWNSEILTHINRAAVFIPVISRRAQQRVEGYFRREWHKAIKRTEGMADTVKFILPVVVDDVEDGADQIPAEFWSRQASRFPGGEPSEEFVELVRELVRQDRERSQGFRR